MSVTTNTEISGVGGVNVVGTSPVSGGGVAPGATAADMQALIAAGEISFSAGAFGLGECLLLGSNTTVEMSAGTTLTNAGVEHTMIRTGNAEYSGAETPIPGISIYCADQQIGGAGTLRYTHATTTLAWSAPGDAAYGTEISVAAVSSVATSAILAIPSAAAGLAIYVIVIPNGSRVANVTRTVRVAPVTGARPVTWTRTSNVRTVSEASHGRQVGDFAILFSSVGASRHGFVSSVSLDAWTIADTGSDVASATAGSAYGVRNVKINTNGARLNYNRDALATASGSNTIAVLLSACSDTSIDAPQIDNATKYAVLVVGFANVEANGVRSFRPASSDLDGNSDTVHICGPGRTVRATGTRSQAGDNIIGIGCCDYADFNINFPAYGSCSIDGIVVDGVRCENTDQQPVRLYNANGANVLSRVEIKNVTGTYNTSTDSCVAIISDATASQVDAGDTNIDGLIIDAPDAARVDGSASNAVVFRGTGTRKNIRLKRVKPRIGTPSVPATVSLEAPMEDISIEYESGSFSGALALITGAFTVKRVDIDVSKRVNGDNALGGVQPTIFQTNASTSVAAFVKLSGEFDDTSASGAKTVGILNKGTISRADCTGLRAYDGDAIVRNNSTATLTEMLASGITADTSYILANDGAVGSVDFTNVHHTSVNASAVFHNNATAGGTTRVKAHGVRAGNRFLRNVAGSSVYLLDAPTVEAVTYYVSDAGTPSLRLTASTNMPVDGALLDATVTNHRGGIGFYNTNAAYGLGVGAYVRGAAAWTRVAI